MAIFFIIKLPLLTRVAFNAEDVHDLGHLLWDILSLSSISISPLAAPFHRRALAPPEYKIASVGQDRLRKLICREHRDVRRIHPNYNGNDEDIGDIDVIEPLTLAAAGTECR